MWIFFWVNIFRGWTFLRGEYFSRVNIFKGGTFFRGEYFSEVIISKGWIFFMCEYFSFVNIFHDKYFSGVNISQFKFRICTDYFGLVVFEIELLLVQMFWLRVQRNQKHGYVKKNGLCFSDWLTLCDGWC